MRACPMQSRENQAITSAHETLFKRDMDKTPKILVTGATSGLGREIALQLATSGEQVLACGRRAERLAELEATAGITGKTLDLSDPDAIRAFCAATGPL